MELRDYLRVLRKNLIWLILLTALGVSVAAAWSYTRVPEYSSTSVVFVSTSSSATLSELVQGSNFTEQRVSTYSSLVNTPAVLNPVIADLNLDVTAAELSQQVTSSVPLNTTLIRITVTDTIPERAADTSNAIAQSLGEQVGELESQERGSVSPVRLTQVTEAVVPTDPVSPRIPLNLTLGALIGLAVGITIAVLREVLDTRIRTVNHIQAITDQPIIGAIPFDPKAKQRPIILGDDPHNPRSEAFRSLRTNLQFLDLDGDHSFVVTSSVPSEGKTTTAINLAIAMADAGKRVALVDGDLRLPKVAEYLNIEGSAGLSNVLIGEARLEVVMRAWGGRSLFVLPAGKIPPNPSELLGSVQMRSLVEYLTEHFDVVIIDAPPLLPVTDAAILSKLTTGALVAVAVARTRRPQLHGAIEALGQVDAKLAGLVLSMVPKKGVYGDGYGYGYGYGYGGYGYTQPAAKPKRARKNTDTAESDGTRRVRQR